MIFGTNESMTSEARDLLQHTAQHAAVGAVAAVDVSIIADTGAAVHMDTAVGSVEGSVEGGGAHSDAGGSGAVGEAVSELDYDPTFTEGTIHVMTASSLKLKFPTANPNHVITNSSDMTCFSTLLGLPLNSYQSWQYAIFNGHVTGQCHFLLSGERRTLQGVCKIFTCVIYKKSIESDPFVVYSLMSTPNLMYHDRLKEFVENLRDQGSDGERSKRNKAIEMIVKGRKWDIRKNTSDYSLNERREIESIFNSRLHDFAVIPPVLTKIAELIQVKLKFTFPIKLKDPGSKAAGVVLHASLQLLNRILNESSDARHDKSELLDYPRFCEHILEEKLSRLSPEVKKAGDIWDVVFEFMTENDDFHALKPWITHIDPEYTLRVTALSDTRSSGSRRDTDDCDDSDECEFPCDFERVFMQSMHNLLDRLKKARSAIGERIVQNIVWKLGRRISENVAESGSQFFLCRVVELLNKILSVSLGVLKSYERDTDAYLQFQLKRIIPEKLSYVLQMTEIFQAAFFEDISLLIGVMKRRGAVVFPTETAPLIDQIGAMLATVSNQAEYELPDYSDMIQTLSALVPQTHHTGGNAIKCVFEDMVKVYEAHLRGERPKRQRKKVKRSTQGDSTFQGRGSVPPEEAVEGRTTRSSEGASATGTGRLADGGGQDASMGDAAGVVVTDEAPAAEAAPATVDMNQPVASNIAGSRQRRTGGAPDRFRVSMRLSMQEPQFRTGLNIPGIHEASNSPVSVITPCLKEGDEVRRTEDLPLCSPRKMKLERGFVTSLKQVKLLGIMQPTFYALVNCLGRTYYVAANLLHENNEAASNLLDREKKYSVVITDFHRSSGFGDDAIFVCSHSAFSTRLTEETINTAKQRIKESVSISGSSHPRSGSSNLRASSGSGSANPRSSGGSRQTSQTGISRVAQGGSGSTTRQDSTGDGVRTTGAGGSTRGRRSVQVRGGGACVTSHDSASESESEIITSSSIMGAGDGVPPPPVIRATAVSVEDFARDGVYEVRREYDEEGVGPSVSYDEMIQKCTVRQRVGREMRLRRGSAEALVEQEQLDATEADKDYMPVEEISTVEQLEPTGSVIEYVDPDLLRNYVCSNPSHRFYYLHLKAPVDNCMLNGLPRDTGTHPNVFILVCMDKNKTPKVHKDTAGVILKLLNGIKEHARRQIRGPMEARIPPEKGCAVIGKMTLRQVGACMSAEEFLLQEGEPLHQGIARCSGVQCDVSQYIHIHALCDQLDRNVSDFDVPTLNHFCNFMGREDQSIEHIRSTQACVRLPQLTVGELPALKRPLCVCLGKNEPPVRVHYRIFGDGDQLPTPVENGTERVAVFCDENGMVIHLNKQYDNIQAMLSPFSLWSP